MNRVRVIRLRMAPRPRPPLIVEAVRRRVVNHDSIGSTGPLWRHVSVPRVRFLERADA